MGNPIIWAITRWYFWLIVIINFFISAPKQLVRFSEYSGAFLGSFLIVYAIFTGIRLVFWIIGKIRRKK